jgi:hypothetical protein
MFGRRKKSVNKQFKLLGGCLDYTNLPPTGMLDEGHVLEQQIHKNPLESIIHIHRPDKRNKYFINL